MTTGDDPLRIHHGPALDRATLVLNIFLLMTVVAVPFPTALVAEHLRNSGAADAVVSYQMNSRTFGTAANRPTLIITAHAIPEPSSLALLGCGAVLGLRRRRGWRKERTSDCRADGARI